MAETPAASSPQVERRMKATARRDTPAELAVRSLLHRRGLRYRVDMALPGTTRGRPDIAFPKLKVAVFVDGCFWHSCPEHATSPKANSDWWSSKLSANTARDRRHTVELETAGWRVLRFWEHESAEVVADAIEREVRSRSRPMLS